MVAVTFEGAPVVDSAAPAKAARRKPWYARLIDALVEARMEQARREVARHRHFVPYALDEHSNRIIKAGARDMPFGGW